jgi:hypothetical protein
MKGTIIIDKSDLIHKYEVTDCNKKIVELTRTSGTRRVRVISLQEYNNNLTDKKFEIYESNM